MRPLIYKRYMLRFGAVVVQAAIKSSREAPEEVTLSGRPQDGLLR